jgi:hypothetical protein
MDIHVTSTLGGKMANISDNGDGILKGLRISKVIYDLFIALIGPALGSAIVWGFSHLSPSTLPLGGLTKYAILLQAVTIFCLIFARPELFPVTVDTEARRNAFEASGQFLRFWFFAWVVWLLFYALEALTEWYPDWANTVPTITHFAKDACNLTSACMLLLTYQTMVTETTGPTKVRKKYDLMVMQYLIAFGALIAIEALVTGPKVENSLHFYFDSLNGLINAVAIALLAGRLGSRLLGLSIYPIVALYAYAGIQILFPIFESSSPLPLAETQRLVISIIAFAGKLILFWEISRLAKNGFLTYYMFAFRSYYENGDEERKKFFED